MHVDSVNAGRAELMKIGARTVSTGIRKAPVVDAWCDPEPDVGMLERVLAAPVAVRDRAGFEQKLARLYA